MPIKVLRDAGGPEEPPGAEILKAGTCDSFEKVLRDVDGSGEPPRAEMLKAGTCDSFLSLILE
jgi:hypothetical protein